MVDKLDMAQKVRSWREAKGITQNAVAKISGISPADVGRIERGQAGADITRTLHDLLYSGAGGAADVPSDTDNRAEIADNLKRLRIASGLTQGRLARIASVNQQYIGRLEQGSVSKAVYIPAIAAALKVRPEDIDPLFHQKFPTMTAAASPPIAPTMQETSKSDHETEEVVSSLMGMAEKIEDRLGFRPTMVQTLQYLAKQAGL